MSCHAYLGQNCYSLASGTKISERYNRLFLSWLIYQRPTLEEYDNSCWFRALYSTVGICFEASLLFPSLSFDQRRLPRLETTLSHVALQAACQVSDWLAWNWHMHHDSVYVPELCFDSHFLGRISTSLQESPCWYPSSEEDCPLQPIAERTPSEYSRVQKRREPCHGCSARIRPSTRQPCISISRS